MSDLSTKKHAPLSDETKRRGAMVLRTLPILMIPFFVTLVTFVLLRLTVGDHVVARPEGVRDGPPFGPLIPIVVLVIFFSSLILLVRMGRPNLSALALIGVWTLITTLTALQNGVTTFFPALLIIPICVAGLLIDGVASVSLAALATLLIGSTAFLETRGYIVPRPPPPLIAANLPFLAVGYWIALFWTVAALTSLLAGSMHRALKQSRAHAQALQELSAQLEARVEQQTTQLLDQERESATLAERARLAREIHDTLAQGLTGIVVQLGAAQRALTAAPE
jgi:signal transduction histidine kinase